MQIQHSLHHEFAFHLKKFCLLHARDFHAKLQKHRLSFTAGPPESALHAIIVSLNKSTTVVFETLTCLRAAKVLHANERRSKAKGSTKLSLKSLSKLSEIQENVV